MNFLSSMKNSAELTCGKIMLKKNEMEEKRKKTMLICGKAMNVMMMAFMFIMMSGMATFAAGSSKGSGTASALIGNIVAIILAMFRWVGVVLLVWGVAQFIMAIKRTDAESKSDAIQTIICSIVLISLKTIIDGLGIDGLTIGSADI